MNQLLLKHLDPQAWRAQLPIGNRNRSRTIGAMFAHMHNCRLNWLRLTPPISNVPRRSIRTAAR